MSPYDGHLTEGQTRNIAYLRKKNPPPRHRDSLASSQADQKDYGLCVFPTTAQTRYQRTGARERQRAMKKKSLKGKCGAGGMLTNTRRDSLIFMIRPVQWIKWQNLNTGASD